MFVSPDETWFQHSSSVAFFSSESKQHEDTQWCEMNSASHMPPHRPDLHVHQSNRTISLIYVSEQDIHKSIKMAHQTYLFLYLLLYMFVVVMSRGAVMGNTDGSAGDAG